MLVASEEKERSGVGNQESVGIWEVNLECFISAWGEPGMEHIWRTGEELGPVSVVPQTRSPGFPVSFAVGMSVERPLSLSVSLGPPWVTRGSMEEVLE